VVSNPRAWQEKAGATDAPAAVPPASERVVAGNPATALGCSVTVIGVCRFALHAYSHEKGWPVEAVNALVNAMGDLRDWMYGLVAEGTVLGILLGLFMLLLFASIGIS
jgi:hypothetical protein